MLLIVIDLTISNVKSPVSVSRDSHSHLYKICVKYVFIMLIHVVNSIIDIDHYVNG